MVRRIGSAALVILLAATVAFAQRARVRDLPQQWRIWIEEEVYPLISTEQRDAFLALETDAQRTEFVDRLWQVWGENSGHGSEYRRMYQERLEFVRSEFGNTKEDRARVYLLHGPPQIRKEVDCQGVFFPLEFWMWDFVPGLGPEVTVVFYQPYGLGRFRLWDPMMDSIQALYNFTGRTLLAQPRISQFERPEYRCIDGAVILRLLARVEFWMNDLKSRSAMHRAIPPGEDGQESAEARFLQFSTVVSPEAQPLPFEVDAEVLGRRGSKVRVAFRASIPREKFRTVPVGEIKAVQVDVVGEVSREGTMVDRFRYSFTFPEETEVLPVVIEREVWPGSYSMRMKVSDSNTKAAGSQEISFEVATPTVEALPRDPAAERELDRVAGGREPVLALLGPQGEGLFGLQRFSAMAGPEVDRVEFFLDGRSIMTRNSPPYEVSLDLGPLPRLATVMAVAYDRDGEEMDRKKLDVNVGRERFMVRLQPVSAADREGNRVRMVAEVNAPSEHEIEQVELFWNDLKVSTLYQEPFETWVNVEESTAIGYLRALATLDDGSQAEDVQFVNAPQFLTMVDVEAVELPVTVVGRDGRPVEGLTVDDFVVEEDGVRQEITHFSVQEELPIRLAMVIDTSGSMQDVMSEVQRVVMGFLRNMLRPKDRALIVAFSDRPALLQRFTADFSALERAVIGLRADRATALYDAVIYGLFQFSGVRGRRAMILLSDGEDNASRADSRMMLDYAQRSGVTVYTIGIDLPLREIRTRSQLTRLARVTGGDAVFLDSNAGLAPVYERIERELRSQYLIAYTSSSTSPRDVFREVTVRVSQPGLRVRTIAGYYPGD